MICIGNKVYYEFKEQHFNSKVEEYQYTHTEVREYITLIYYKDLAYALEYVIIVEMDSFNYFYRNL